MVKKPASSAGPRSVTKVPPARAAGGLRRAGMGRRRPLRRTGISGRSITAMVVGICSLPLFIPIPLPGMIPGLGFILGIVAIILASIELKAVAKGGMDPRSRGFAIAGMATGIMGVVTGIFIIIFFGAVIMPAICAAIAKAVTSLQGGQIPIPR